MIVSSVEGQFEKFKGQFNFSQEKNLLEMAEINIEAKSIHTNDEKRDRHLLGKDFFETQKYPLISLSLNNISLPPNKLVKSEFLVQMKGVKKKESFMITNLGSKKDPWGKPSHFFLIEGEISRKDYGLNWNRTLDQGGYLVGDKVKLRVRLEAQESGKKTPFSRYYIPATESIDNLAKAQRGEIQPSPKVEIHHEPSTVKKIEVTSKQDTKNQLSKEKEKEKVQDNLGNLVLGFVGFILTSLVCILIKIKLLKRIKEDQKSSYFMWEIIGDSIVLIIVFIYSVLFYQLLYPN